YAPPQPRSNRTLWIVLSIVGGFVLLACIACVALGIVFTNFAGNFIKPVGVVTQFCQDLRAQDYTDAYDLFSTNLEARITRADFINRSQRIDSSDGFVTACRVTSGDGTNVQVDASTVTLPVTITRNGNAQEGNITLVKDGDTWKIDTLDPSFRLTV